VIAGAILMGLGFAGVHYFDIQDPATAIFLLMVPCNTVLLLMMARPMTRRLHDLGLSGSHLAWILPILLAGPFVGTSADLADTPLLIPVPGAVALISDIVALCASMVLLAMFFWPGNKGANRYGPPPA
jgi:uncharacterized membrane protein YhaH (DUF805 family)